MPKQGIDDLVTHFALAWGFRKLEGSRRPLDGYARAWLRDMRSQPWDEVALAAIKSIAGAKYPGEALLAGYRELINQRGENV